MNCLFCISTSFRVHAAPESWSKYTTMPQSSHFWTESPIFVLLGTSPPPQKKYLPRLAPLAGGMKFATQISPLLNFIFSISGNIYAIEGVKLSGLNMFNCCKLIHYSSLDESKIPVNPDQTKTNKKLFLSHIKRGLCKL